MFLNVVGFYLDNTVCDVCFPFSHRSWTEKQQSGNVKLVFGADKHMESVLKCYYILLQSLAFSVNLTSTSWQSVQYSRLLVFVQVESSSWRMEIAYFKRISAVHFFSMAA